MTDEIVLKAVVEKDEDSAACGVRVSTADVMRWFGRKSRVPVVATINGHSYRSSLMPMGGCHILSVNTDVRKNAKVGAGDKVQVHLREDSGPRTVQAPADLTAALKKAGMLAAFDSLSFTHRKEWVKALQDAKRPETRAKRVADCVEAVRSRRKV